MTDDEIARLRKLAEREARDRHDAAQWCASHSERDDRDEWAYVSLMDLRNAVDGATILALLDERDALRRERDEAKRVIDDAYAALGGDAWWMDPPDGGSPTLAEMVAKANEDGRALYDVKRERDAAVALLRECRELVSPPLSGAERRLADRLDALLGGGEGV